MKEFVDENSVMERSTEIDVITQNTLLREITKELKDTVRKKELKALAAPSIGYDRRVFVINFSDLEIKTYINPVIAQAKGLSLSRETCDLIPDKEYIMLRNNDINVVYQTPTGKVESRQLLGAAAYIFQQQLQILDGILPSDIGLEILPGFDDLTDEEREEIISMYLDSLDLRVSEVNKDIEQDPELKQINDGIAFMESVYKGETELEDIPDSKEA